MERMVWENGFSISVRIERDAAVICANREGMLSLARRLTELASAQAGDHIHLDACNSLEDGSVELILERIG